MRRRADVGRNGVLPVLRCEDHPDLVDVRRVRLAGLQDRPGAPRGGYRMIRQVGVARWNRQERRAGFAMARERTVQV